MNKKFFYMSMTEEDLEYHYSQINKKKLKHHIGAPLIWIAFTVVLFYQKPTEFIIPLAIITGVSFAAATFLATDYVRSYIYKNKKQQMEEDKDQK